MRTKAKNEIHAALTYPGHPHVPFATVGSPAAAESIVFNSASKAFNLPGLKAALAVAGGSPAWRLLSQVSADVLFGSGLLGVGSQFASGSLGRSDWSAIVSEPSAPNASPGVRSPMLYLRSSFSTSFALERS